MIQRRLIKRPADKKGSATKKFLSTDARPESYDQRKTGARGLFRSVMGLVSLVVYLAIIGGGRSGGATDTGGSHSPGRQFPPRPPQPLQQPRRPEIELADASHISDHRETPAVMLTP